MLLLDDVQFLRDCDRAAKEDTPNLEDPPGPDARLPSSLNYNMHENVPCRVVQIASSPVSWHQPRRAVAVPGMKKHREILVVRSSFLMRLLSHNPLSTPFDPPLLLRRIFDPPGAHLRSWGIKKKNWGRPLILRRVYDQIPARKCPSPLRRWTPWKHSAQAPCGHLCARVELTAIGFQEPGVESWIRLRRQG